MTGSTTLNWNWSTSTATAATTNTWYDAVLRSWYSLSYNNGVPLTYNTTINVYNTRIQQSRRRSEELAQARVRAQDRAEQFLLEMLSPSQRERYQLAGEFEVMGSAGNLYRIRRGISGNIDWIKPDGKFGGRLCAHPTMQEGWLPMQDVVLAQLLALTTDEPAFVRRANVHAGERPPLPV
jgi:hypothetical protein